MKEAERLGTLAQYYEDMGDYLKAESLLTESLELRQRQLGANHLDLAGDFYNLGLLNLAMDKNERAEKLLIRCLLIRRLHFDSEHPDVVDALEALSLLTGNQAGLARAN